ncbi:hypothetical protein DP125_13645 [Clostridium tetani]|uniref:hypothetical protein n=1 Tax=Clostridium phage phiCT19406C TaxID=1567011 RepID=UPI000514691A|nr:hypothetical protein [Clostridium tetani]YP_009218071.1 hypothetical protein phiCT19406C_42 [Clostridium phage phiCT19406C]AJA42865.1 hypothetical protein phiCT19406C_42 [Clostridium phage phiCT19406C]KGI44663.1 hypothetical protein KY54_07245 [Clostridium tetani]KHO30858.1 hypothetical protein OR63_13420 [Clostridium tetani]RXI57496.1 hypothetical protein DP125_13645 [Clostridium tetani]RXI62338.1 hypothetical protein DP132_06675 [Clostridium tetani]
MKKKGINKIYGFMLENMAKEDTKISIKELKYMSDLVYNWIVLYEEDVKVIINEYKKVSVECTKQ